MFSLMRKNPVKGVLLDTLDTFNKINDLYQLVDLP